MKVKAIRGVCIGVNRHLKAGDVEDLDAATVQFLKSIGAVVDVPVEAAPNVKDEKETTPKGGKKEKTAP